MSVEKELNEIYDGILGCDLAIETSLYGNQPGEEVEKIMLHWLHKLLRLSEEIPELQHLQYAIQEAAHNFDVTYIISELEKLGIGE